MKAYYNAFTLKGITQLPIPGGTIHRQGGTFDRDMVRLRASSGGQPVQYYAPAIIAPGTDNLRFVVEFLSPAYKLGTWGTCPTLGTPRMDAYYDDGDPDIDQSDNSLHQIALPYFHNKSSFPPFGWRIERIELYVTQPDGSDLNSGIFGLPEYEVEI
jgi:hypothetical protein